MKSWYRFENQTADASVAEIHIIDFIGSWDDDWIARNWGYDMGVTAKSFLEELAKLPATVNTLRVHINSPGGDVQAGVNIANALREQQTSKGRTVETYIDGMAASIASVIAMAGSKVVMADNALMMVHNPWSYAIGEAKEMRKVADILDTIRGQIIATYAWHSPLSADDVIALMDAETWMDAATAIEKGFATDKVEGLKVAASISPVGVAKLKVPEQYKARVDALVTPKPAETPKPQAATAEQVLAECPSVAVARELLAAGATLDQVKSRVAADKLAADAEASRTTEIRALCDRGHVPELADSYIAGRMPVDQVKAQVLVINAKLDKKVEVDGSILPNGNTNPAAASALTDAYAKLNQPSKSKE